MLRRRATITIIYSIPFLAALLFIPQAYADDEFAEGKRESRGIEVFGTKRKSSKPPKSSAKPPIKRASNHADAAMISAGMSVLPGELDPLVCWVGDDYICSARKPSATPAKPKAHRPPSQGQVEDVVRTLVARLDVPDSVPQVGPDPSLNEWNMAVVGLPLWLWVPGEPTMSSHVSGNGITITMDARRTHTTFSMGDGKSVRCTKMPTYPKKVTKPGLPSPTCGHIYAWPSLPKGNYRLTATSHWTVDWAALGYAGTIPLEVTGERELPVGELHSLVVR